MSPGPSATLPGWCRVRRGRVCLDVRADLENVACAAGLLDPERIAALLSRPGGAEGRGRTVVLPLDAAREPLVLRPLRHGGVLGPLLGPIYLGLARPRREIAVTVALRAAGAPVPAPALALGIRALGPFWRALLGTERERDARDALAFLDERPPRASLLQAAAAAGRAVRRFHDAGGVHPDLHLKNLLLRAHASGFDAIVIDLDRASIAPGVPPRERMAELMRLLRSVHKRGVLAQVGVRGVVRFFAAYHGGDRALRAALLEGRAREERRIARHAWLWRRARATQS